MKTSAHGTLRQRLHESAFGADKAAEAVTVATLSLLALENLPGKEEKVTASEKIQATLPNQTVAAPLSAVHDNIADAFLSIRFTG